MTRETLLEHQYGECGVMFRTVWDFYLKFYVSFMALNFTALGLMVQYIGDRDKRLIIVISFGVQNLLSAITALAISAYGAWVAKQQKAIIGCSSSTSEDATSLAFASTVPSRLASWGARANAISHVLFMVCWIAAMFVDPPLSKPASAEPANVFIYH